MKTFIAAAALVLASSGALAESWYFGLDDGNADLYGGVGNVLVSNVGSNANENPDLYGNGLGYAGWNQGSAGQPVAVRQPDFGDPHETGGNPDLYAAQISATECML